jgi:hypothetical protein
MKLFGVVLGLVLFVSLAVSDKVAAADRNKCGCYKDGAGTCFCDKKAKCGCPGDCEPKGCDEARNRELEKEIQAETKKAEASQHRKSGGGQNDEESSAREEAPAAKKASSHRMSAAQGKQLAKLLDLYLSDHPDARGKSIEEVRGEVAGH